MANARYQPAMSQLVTAFCAVPVMFCARLAAVRRKLAALAAAET